MKMMFKYLFIYLFVYLLPIAALSLLQDRSPSTRLRTPTSKYLATESKNRGDGTQSFPISNLLENAKEIDDNLANGERLGTYSESTWSNR